MTDEPQKKPDPIEDVRKGLGLLFRAATTAVNSLPTDKLETAVVSGVKEVGRAIENVAHAIDKEVFKNGKPVYGTTKPPQPYAGDVKTDAPKSEEQKTSDGPTFAGGDKDDGKVWATQQPPSPMDPPAPDAPTKSPEDPQNPAPPPPPGEPTTDSTKS